MRRLEGVRGFEGVRGLEEVLDPEEALALLSADPEAVGPLAGRPLLAVRAHGRAAPRVGELARRLPVVTVAVAPELSGVPAGVENAGFDVLLTAEPAPPAPWVGPPSTAGRDPLDWLVAALAALRDTADRSPLASVALVQLLRYSAGLDVRDAVVAESFVYSSLQAGPEFAAWLAGHRARRADPGERAAPAGPAAPAAPAVLVERDGGALCVTLNRPRVRNAVNTEVRDGLVAAFTLAAADSSIESVRLTGAGPSFCSGGDLAEFGTLPDPARAHAVRTARGIPLALSRCAERVTAVVHGSCVGAGVELPSFAGRVIAAPGTTFRLPELTMGLVPGAGGTAGIARRAGRERAAFLALTGWSIGVDVALDWGLVDEVRSVDGTPRVDRTPSVGGQTRSGHDGPAG
jgi:enoyl-CoA hydratase/carnithine racemase